MRNLIYISFTIFLCSCASPAKMFNSGLKKINKAIERDPSIKLPADTIIDYKIKLIPGKDGKDSIIREIITETINNCNYDELKVRSAKELRYAKKELRDSLKHVERMYKLETKRKDDSLDYLIKENKELTKQVKSNNSKEKVIQRQKTKQERGGWFERTFGRYWWILPLIALILGLVGGFYIRNLIPSIPNIFKRK